jgi:hypothetical protein
MDHLIGKYEELKKQEIYFASQNELNDPLEGMLQIVWDGDEISWKGLINNYLLCLEHTFALYRLAASMEELMDIPVFKTIDSLPTNKYRNHFNEIKKEFFQKAEVSQLIKAFGKENILIQKKELLYFLRYFHRVAIKIIIESHHKNGLVSDEEMQHVSKLNYLEELDSKVINAFVNAKTDKDKELNELFEFSSSMYEQFLLLKKVEIYNNFNDMQKKWLFINLEFPEKYVENLIKLIYPNCFVSCFSEDYSNSSMWGNYANAHKGACLIFETKKIEEKRNLTLYLPYSISSQGISYKYSDIEFSKVTYNSKFHTINFFDSLGRLNGIQLEQWLVDENKNKSKNYNKIYKDMNHWRENYWNLFKKINCNKTKDWEYENEFRLYITDSFFEFNRANERAIKYKFEDLNGVIFGIKSCIEDKIEIIKIIKQKCKEEKREEFNFYQAVYDYRADKIKIMKLDVLSQFKITEDEQL